MKTALDALDLLSSKYLMFQPLGYFVPEKCDFRRLPDYPFAMEARTINRFDVHKFTREAYDLGVRLQYNWTSYFLKVMFFPSIKNETEPNDPVTVRP